MSVFHPFHVIHYHGAAPLQRGQPAPPLALAPLIRHLQGYELLKLVAGPWGESARTAMASSGLLPTRGLKLWPGFQAELTSLSFEGEFRKIWGK